MSGIKDISIPKLIVMVAGTFMVISYFLADQTISNAGTTLSVTATIVSYFALATGMIALVLFHSKAIITRRDKWQYSIITLVVLFGVLALGLTTGVKGTLYSLLYQSIESPLEATTYGILGFYIASASYRAFRIRSTESALFLAGTLGVMLKNAPVGGAIWSGFVPIGEWLFIKVNAATNRAILMGIATGSFLLFFRILRGRETRYLGE